MTLNEELQSYIIDILLTLFWVQYFVRFREFLLATVTLGSLTSLFVFNL